MCLLPNPCDAKAPACAEGCVSGPLGPTVQHRPHLEPFPWWFGEWFGSVPHPRFAHPDLVIYSFCLFPPSDHVYC